MNSQRCEWITLYFLSGGPFLTGVATSSCNKTKNVNTLMRTATSQPKLWLWMWARTSSIKTLWPSVRCLSVILNSSCCLCFSSSQRCRASWYRVSSASFITWRGELFFIFQQFATLNNSLWKPGIEFHLIVDFKYTLVLLWYLTDDI